MNGVAPESAQIHLLNVPSSAAYAETRYSMNGIAAAGVGWDAAGKPLMSVSYRAPGDLRPGTYSDTVEVQLCVDAACANPIAGASASLAVKYEVTPYDSSHPPTVSLPGAPCPTRA